MAEPFVGEVRMFASDYPIMGWASCDGQKLPIDQHGQLFGIIRVAATGKKVAPPLFGTLSILGRERVLELGQAPVRVLEPVRHMP